MHICYITSEFPKQGFPHGGVGTFIATMAKSLVEKGISVSVIGLNYENKYEEEIVNGIKIYRLQVKKTKGLQWFYNSKVIARKIQEVHAENPIHVVETSELGLAFIPKIKSITYLIRLHGGHHFFVAAENRKKEWWKVFQEKRSFKKADEIVAVSHYVGETTSKLLRLNDREIQVIYNPIDTRKFYQSDSTKLEKYSIFFAGSIIEKKGIRQLVQAINLLIDQYPGVHLYVAGRDANLPGTNIPYRPILNKEINEKIKPHITFLGVIANDKIINYIEKAEVCCYPSHMEAMPLAWLEVLAMGKIFIGSKTGPGIEAVSDKQTGFLVDPFSPEDIAKKISWVFDHPEEAKEIGECARKVAIQKFDLSIIVQQNIDFYTRIVGKKR